MPRSPVMALSGRRRVGLQHSPGPGYHRCGLRAERFAAPFLKRPSRLAPPYDIEELLELAVKGPVGNTPSLDLLHHRRVPLIVAADGSTLLSGVQPRGTLLLLVP